MKMTNIPFGLSNWSEVEQTEHKGTAGMAYWRTRQFGDLRVRMVEYTPGYQADHWCSKGHILLCLEGELHVELQDVAKTGERNAFSRATRAARVAPHSLV